MANQECNGSPGQPPDSPVSITTSQGTGSVNRSRSIPVYNNTSSALSTPPDAGFMPANRTRTVVDTSITEGPRLTTNTTSGTGNFAMVSNETLNGRKDLNKGENTPQGQNQTIPDGALPGPETMKDPLLDKILRHVNDTPAQEAGTLTYLTVGAPGYEKSGLFFDADRVGWVEGRGGEEFRIRIYNLTTGRELVIPLNGTRTFYYPPSLCGDNLVYTGDTPGVYGAAIYLRNLTTNDTIIISAGDADTDKDMPVIQGHYIVYTEERYNWNVTRSDGFIEMVSGIRLYDLGSGQDTLISPVSNEIRRSNPVISGDKIAWAAYPWSGSEPGIEIYNTSSGALSGVTPDLGPLFTLFPKIDDNRAVFEMFSPVTWNYDIFLLNLTTGVVTNLTPETDTTNQQYADIDRNSVVYVDDAGIRPGIFRLDLTTGVTTIITSSKDAYFPEIHGDRVFFMQNNPDSMGYLMFTAGDPQPPVAAGFSVNTTFGGVPLSVRFSDASTGPVMVHHWEFGDGTESYEASPLHTYAEPGRFDVSLTVGSPYYRDSTFRAQLVTAGASPDASFTMDPPSGIEGLTVHFNDTSRGYCDRWDWDFGDNTTSKDRNTTHQYLAPGTYTVTLSAGNEWGTDMNTGSLVVIPATSRTLSLAVPGQVRYSPDSREIVLDETATPEFGFFLVNNSTTLTIRPSDGLFLPSYTLNSADPQGFSRVNHTISGRVDRVWFTSPDLNSSEFGEHTLYDNWEILRGTEYTDEVGANASMNFTIELPDYNPAGMIDTAVTRRYTSDEYQIYNIALQKADRADGMTDIAYVLHCNKNALEGTGPATLTMTVSRDWVVHYSQFIIPEHRLKLYKLDENGNPVFDASWNYVFLNTSLLSRDPSTREYVFVVSDPGGINLSRMALWGAPFEQDFPDSPIRVIEYDSESLLPASVTLAVNASYLENNLNGTRWHYVEEPMTIVRVNDTGGTEVLDTKFLYYDPVRKVDVFQAYSPQGLSEFALMPVYTAGNPLQMIYLSLNTRVTPTPAPTPAPMSTRTIPYGSAGGGGGGGYSGSGTIGTVPVTQGAATGTTPSLNEQSIALADDGALIPSEQAGARSEVPLPSPSGHVSVPPQAVAPTQGMTVSIFTVVAELAIMVSACVLVMVSIYVRRKNQ